MPGTVSLRPLSANLTRNTELFGTMDPYCKVLLGKQKITGQVCKNGGKHPVWDETLVLKRTDEPNCVLELKEHDWLLPDGTIGECNINLKEVEDKQRVLKWYPLTFTGKPVGQILLEINYEMEGRANVNKFEVPAGFTEVKKEEKFIAPAAFTEVKQEKLPAGWTEVANQNNVQHIGPGVMHGYHPEVNQYNNANQYQQQNQIYNQDVQQNMFAPPAQEVLEGYKYPTFENQYYGNNNLNNQATHNVHEVIDYRNQPNGLNTQNAYPGVTNQPLTPTHQHDKEVESTGWDPIKLIRGAVARK